MFVEKTEFGSSCGRQFVFAVSVEPKIVLETWWFRDAKHKTQHVWIGHVSTLTQPSSWCTKSANENNNSGLITWILTHQRPKPNKQKPLIPVRRSCFVLVITVLQELERMPEASKSVGQLLRLYIVWVHRTDPYKWFERNAKGKTIARETESFLSWEVI